VLPTIAGLFIYITGYLTEYLNDAAAKAGQTGLWLDEKIGQLAYALYVTVPNLQQFSLKNQILSSQPNDPPMDMQIANLILYGLAYAFSGYLIAYWVFRRKEL
jgi:hypothetical protein